MKIKKLTVESFGKLKNRTIEFSDGINVIKGANESGKSSLARFIRFMLYGFTSRNADISKNDKKKYMPWDGSPCKGSMELVTENGSFTVRREQTARASHSISDSNGVPVYQGENPGNALLGVDEDTYDKTALISAGDVYFDDAVSLSSAIKNMVFSADSDIDSEAAVKKLDALRKSILGSAERSGRLYEARKEMSELALRKEELAGTHKELLAAEAMLEKIKQNIARNNGAIEQLEREKHNLEALDALEKTEKAEELKAKYDNSNALYIKKSTDMTIDGFLPDRSFLSGMNDNVLSLGEAEAKLEGAKSGYEDSERRLKDCYSDTKQFAFNNALAETGKSAQSVKEDVSVLKNKLKSKKRIAIILTILIITIPVALFFFAGCGKIKKQLERLCAELDCKDVPELEQLLDNSKSAEELAKSAKARFEQAKAYLSACYEERRKICESLRAMLEKCKVSVPESDTVELMRLAKEQIRHIGFSVEGLEALDKKLSIDKASYENYMNSLGDFETLKALAASFDEGIPIREASKNAKELDFYKRATEGLYVQEREYEKKAAVIASNMEKPDELAAKQSMLEKEIEELEKKHAAIIMAKNAIEEAHESMKDNASPILTREASSIFSRMTDGKYKGLYVDNELKLSFLEEGSSEYKSVSYLSTGAADAAYLALRIALVHYLYDEKPVLIFDDAFSRLDDARLEKVCSVLKILASEYQIIILTCHDREGEYLKTGTYTNFEKSN